MKTASHISSVIAAALARRPRRSPAKKKPRKKTRKSPNNYIAETRAGARLGNRNAWRHGRRSAGYRRHRAHVRTLIANTKLLCSQMAALAKQGRETEHD